LAVRHHRQSVPRAYEIGGAVQPPQRTREEWLRRTL